MVPLGTTRQGLTLGSYVTLRARLRIWLSALVAMFSPAPVAPPTPTRKDQPTSAVQPALDEAPDLDETYNLEPFYRGLPIFNAKGERDVLRPGRSYIDGAWIMPGGNTLMIYIDSAAPSTTIEGELGKVRFISSEERKRFLTEMGKRNA